MSSVHCPVDQSVIVAIDIQPKFMKAIHEAERVERRSKLLIRSAQVLDIPVLSTVQNPERMGGFHDEILDKRLPPIEKMAFSCWGSPEFRDKLQAFERSCVVLVGIESHICITLTALDLLVAGYKVFVCPDAISARSHEMHKLGMERMRDSGVMPSHTETLIYEWMGTAEHPSFRDILPLVKEAS